MNISIRWTEITERTGSQTAENIRMNAAVREGIRGEIALIQVQRAELQEKAREIRESLPSTSE